MAKPLCALALGATALLLCGCETAFNLVGVTVPLSASESHNYNGSYQGSIRQAAANGPACPKETGEKVIQIGDNTLWYAYSPAVFFTPLVSYDGTVNASSGDTVLAGKIIGNHLAMVIKSPACQTRISMNYIYNHGG